MPLYGGITLPGRPDLDNIRRLDLMILPALNRYSRVGVSIDIPYLEELSLEFGYEMAELQKEISSYIPPHALDQFSAAAALVEEEEGSATINAASAEQIGVLLFDLLKIGRDKKLKSTSTGKISTGRKNLEFIREQHPVVPLILQYRERQKLKSAFCDSLPGKAVRHPRSAVCPVCELAHAQDTWRLHTTFTTTRAITGRLSCIASHTQLRTRLLIRNCAQDCISQLVVYRAIKDIQIGDEVWTHKKRWRKVTHIWRKGIDFMFNVTFSNGHTLTCTGDHLLLLSSDGCVEKMDNQPAEYKRSPETVQDAGIPNHGADSFDLGDDLSQRSAHLPDSYTETRVRCASGNPVFPDENGISQSNVRQDRGETSQLDRASGRWIRVFDLFEGWEKAIRTSHRYGRSPWPEGVASESGRSSHRRGHQEQQTGQSCACYSCWSSKNSLSSSEGHTFCYVEKIEAAGSFEVFDISVEEDESYEACGVFSHNSKSPNLQQIPIRSEIGSRIRGAFLASPGCRLVSVDFSQMEIRDLAHLANARSMISVYEADGDIHLKTAMQTFGISDPKKVDKYLHRLPSKRVNFGIQNGTTEKGLHAQLVTDYWAAGITPPDWLTPEWCKGFIESWHSAYPEVQPYFEEQYHRARRYGFVWDPWGRTRYIPQVRSSLPWKVHEGFREAQNFPVTASNAEQTKLAMAECEEEFARIRSCGVYCEGLLSIHDQVIAEVEEEYAEYVGELMVRVFESVMDDRETGERLWRTPIKSDCEILERWKSKE